MVQIVHNAACYQITTDKIAEPLADFCKNADMLIRHSVGHVDLIVSDISLMVPFSSVSRTTMSLAVPRATHSVCWDWHNGRFMDGNIGAAGKGNRRAIIVGSLAQATISDTATVHDHSLTNLFKMHPIVVICRLCGNNSVARVFLHSCQ